MRRYGWLPLLMIGAVAVVLFAPLIGGQLIPLSSIWHAQPDDPASMIFWEIRLPRTCLAFIAGAGLAAAGMTFQAMFRNALATPFTLGVSSGASLGAAIGVRLGPAAAALGAPAVSVGAGAMVAIIATPGAAPSCPSAAERVPRWRAGHRIP